MTTQPQKGRLLASAAIGVVAALSCSAAAYAADDTGNQTKQVQEVVVTGSRIPRSQTKTPAPVDLVSAQDLVDRGFTNAGDALNQVTSDAPAFPVTPSASGPAGGGQTYPNLFNLGYGRTLTLVDGHRFVSSSTPRTPSSAVGFGSGGTGQGNGVDTGLIPFGLLERVDVVEAGGAAVYGSDAIAGVVNYVLKKHFEGVEVDSQYGVSGYGDHTQYSGRITAGHNFLDGRANLAVDLEYSKSDPLLMSDRDYLSIGRFAAGTSVIPDAHFYAYNPTGVVFSAPAPVPVCGGKNCFLRSGGTPVTFSPDGSSLVPYNPGLNAAGGSALAPPFANGGDGYPLKDLTALATGVERKTANFLGHIDLTDHLKLSGQFLYSHEVGTDPVGSQGVFRTVLSPAPSNAVTFYNTNPYLTPADLATLEAASPAFAAGKPLYLSKAFNNVLPARDFLYPTDTYSAHLSLDGDFDRWNRHFNYSISYSHGEVDSKQQGWSVNTNNFANALNAVSSGGQIVCADPVARANGCVPINPFGNAQISSAAEAYIDVPIGSQFSNKDDDFLATIGGEVVKLPGGEMQFNLAYEHRHEDAKFEPAAAQFAGLTGSGVPSPNSGGYYDTNEYSGELLVPLLGDNFTLPGVKGLDFSAQGRIVDAKGCGYYQYEGQQAVHPACNAGQNTVWGVGLSLRLEHGLTLRASRSQNFRAPTLYQLFAPTSTNLGGGIQDPCDKRYFNAGPNPSVREANCTALFAANPTYGTAPGGAAPGASTAERLATFTDTAVNTTTAEITSSGNSGLKNEIAETTTYGLVFQPAWAPGGLTITADYINVDILNGITAFAPTNFANSCYDTPGGSAATCGFFTRDQFGNIDTAISTTYNAESLTYKGEVVNIDYRFPLAWIARRPSGNVELQLEATHNEELRQVVDSASTEAVGTIGEPRWVLRGDVRYTYGPWRFTYRAFYLPASLAAEGANASNSAIPVISSNVTHSISGSYDFRHFQIRAGVNNLTNEPPSPGTLTYGDYIGRTFFVGLKAKY